MTRRYAITSWVAKAVGRGAQPRRDARLFVANGATDDITIVDAGAGRVIRSVPVGRTHA